MKLVLTAALAVASAAPIAPPVHAQTPTPSPALLVLEKAQNSLVIVDPATLKIVARVPAGNDPHEVAVSADGKVAYVSNYGGRSGGGGGTTITVIDLVAQKALAPIELGALRAPHGLDYANGKLYFSAENAKVVGRVDPTSRQVDWVIGTGEDRTHMVVVSRDGKRVFTSNVNSASVSIIEERAVPRPAAPPGPLPAGAPPAPPSGGGLPTTDWHVTNVMVGRGAEGMDLTPDGKELWVANSQDATLSVVDVASHKVLHTIPSTKAANRLKITVDGKYAFASDLNGNDMLVIDTKTRAVHKRIAVGTNSEGILMSPDGKHAYTTLNSRDAVAVIDLNTMTVTGEVKTGRGPDGLAWAVRK